MQTPTEHNRLFTLKNYNNGQSHINAQHKQARHKGMTGG